MVIGDVRIRISPYTLNTLSSMMFFVLIEEKDDECQGRKNEERQLEKN